MRLNQKLAEAYKTENDWDPRTASDANVIDLTTRNVLPTVTQRKGPSDAVGLVAGIAIVGALGALTMWGLQAGQTRSPVQSTSGKAPGIAPPPMMMPSAAPIPGSIQPQDEARDLVAPPPQATLSAPAAGVATLPSTNRSTNGAPTLVFDAASVPTSLSGPPSIAQPTSGGDDFAARLGGVGGSAATATAMADPKNTVAQGTLIPAILETAIDTDVPGFVRAVVSADVKSFDGSRVLVPRSSRLVGQYKSGLQAGQKRAYVIWTRLMRPDGVSVAIASPAVTYSGQTGLSGKVNTHFFERFGSAMLLSVVGGLSTIGGNATAIITGGGQSAAAAAVGQGGQIGPTVRVRQGQPIRVFTARDLDFSSVEPR